MDKRIVDGLQDIMRNVGYAAGDALRGDWSELRRSLQRIRSHTDDVLTALDKDKVAA